jgi:hypothetical protein
VSWTAPCAVDPGDALATPGGTGPLGHPIGDGITYRDPGSAGVPDGSQGMPLDGSEGATDGTGTR